MKRELRSRFIFSLALTNLATRYGMVGVPPGSRCLSFGFAVAQVAMNYKRLGELYEPIDVLDEERLALWRGYVYPRHRLK